MRCRFFVIILLLAVLLGKPILAKQTNITQKPAEKNFNSGVELFKKHDLDGAIDALLQAVYFARNGYYPEAYFWLGRTYMDKHEDPKAIGAFKKHLEQAMGASPDAHIYLAEIYLRNNRDDEAQAECDLALTQGFSAGPKAHNLMGEIEAKHGNYAEAQEQFLEALGDPPWNYTEAWMNYAEMFLKQKDWGDAYNQYTGIIQNILHLKDVDLEKVYLNIGICQLAKGNHQGAIDNWHQVLAYNNKNCDAHLQLAMIFDAENHISSAIKEYSEFVRWSSDANKTAKVKERIEILEQKLQPKPQPGAAASQFGRSGGNQQGQSAPTVAPPTIPKESGF